MDQDNGQVSKVQAIKEKIQQGETRSRRTR